MRASGKIAIVAAIVAAAGAFLLFSGHRHGAHQSLDSVSGALAGDSLYQLESRWVDDSGEIRALRDFSGKPAVMAMIYTSCEYACPLIIADMMKIYEGLPANARGGVQFLLVSFDPARDTPDAMGAYKKKQLPAADWNLIAANEDDTLEFAVATGVRYKPVGEEFSHSNTVIVLDAGGREVFRQNGLGNPPDRALAVLQTILAAR